MDVHRVGLERAARREVKVANDLVDLDLAREHTSLVRLLLDPVCPPFRHALLDRVRVYERPPPSDVRLSDVVAGVAAPRVRPLRGRCATIAGAAMAFALVRGHSVELAAELFALR